MTTTRLDGWTEAEYKAWAEKHPDEARTCERSRMIEKEPVQADFREQSKPKIAGYAAVFNKTVELWPGFFERVAPGAFSKTIKEHDIRALWNHNPDYLLGRTTNGTLILREDSRGLAYEIIKPETSMANDLMVLIKRGDVSQSSFGFNIVEQSLKYDKEMDSVTRTLAEVKLFDVSPVTFPAYDSTSVNVRTNDRTAGADRETIVVGNTEPPKPQPSDEELFRAFDEMRHKALDR